MIKVIRYGVEGNGDRHPQPLGSLLIGEIMEFGVPA